MLHGPADIFTVRSTCASTGMPSRVTISPGFRPASFSQEDRGETRLTSNSRRPSPRASARPRSAKPFLRRQPQSRTALAPIGATAVTPDSQEIFSAAQRQSDDGEGRVGPPPVGKSDEPATHKLRSHAQPVRIGNAGRRIAPHPGRSHMRIPRSGRGDERIVFHSPEPSRRPLDLAEPEPLSSAQASRRGRRRSSRRPLSRPPAHPRHRSSPSRRRGHNGWRIGRLLAANSKALPDCRACGAPRPRGSTCAGPNPPPSAHHPEGPTPLVGAILCLRPE